jgi:hypothetical protein
MSMYRDVRMSRWEDLRMSRWFSAQSDEYGRDWSLTFRALHSDDTIFLKTRQSTVFGLPSNAMYRWEVVCVDRSPVPLPSAA